MSGVDSPGYGDDPVPDTEDRTVQADLEICRGGPCFLDDLAEDLLAVDVRYHDGDCQCEVTVDGRDGAETKHFSRQICSYCPGVVFSKHECIPRFSRCSDGSFVIRTFAPDTETVADLVSELRGVSRRVHLRRLVDAGADEDLIATVFDVDVSVLTEKQRETLERAIEAGYYEPEGGGTLGDLAAEFDISKSALSRRLSRAEAKLMRQLVDVDE